MNEPSKSKSSNPHRKGSKPWFRWWGEQGGKLKSEAKSEAARKNGLRGGRPRRKP